MSCAEQYKDHRDYCYYSQNGKLLGQTKGCSPVKELFDQAHYVIVNQKDMIKNLDKLEVIREDIRTCERELIKTPIANIAEILYLNKLLKALRGCLSN